MKITNQYVLFWGGIYSQWYKAPMIIDGKKYNCCEQYMMYQKAILFEPEKNAKIAEQILSTPNPKEQKALGRRVSGFDKAVWDKKCLSIVIKANMAKFSQNRELLDEMQTTGNRIFVEASPYDHVWGIGMHFDDDGVEDPLNWKGTNLLGQALTIVRNELT